MCRLLGFFGLFFDMFDAVFVDDGFVCGVVDVFGDASVCLCCLCGHGCSY